MSEPIKVLEGIPLDENDPKKSTRIGADLEEKIKKDSWPASTSLL